MRSLEAAKWELIEKLKALRPVQFRPQATSADMLAARDNLAELSKAVDAYVLALGSYAKDSTGSIFSVDLFRGVLADAFDLGGTLYELESVAEEIDKHALAGAEHD